MEISYKEAYDEACKVIGQLTMEKHFLEENALFPVDEPAAEVSKSD